MPFNEIWTSVSDTATSAVGIFQGIIEREKGMVNMTVTFGHYEKDAAVTVKVPYGTFSSILSVTHSRNQTGSQYHVPVTATDNETFVIDRDNVIGGDSPLTFVVRGYE